MELPKPGQVLVTYVDRFRADAYAKGRDLTIDGFVEAYAAHGAPVQVCFGTNDAEHEVIGTAVYPDEAAFEAWQGSAHRKKVVDQIRPMLREPLIMRRYVVSKAHAVG